MKEQIWKNVESNFLQYQSLLASATVRNKLILCPINLKSVVLK